MGALQDNPTDPALERGFQLEGLRIDPTTGEVTGPGGCEKLDPKVMDVLVLLAGRAGQVVLREDLITQLWPNMVVTDDALTRCVYELRRQLSQAGGSERYRAMLETLPKRGYRLNGSVTPLQPEPTNLQRARADRPVLASALAIVAAFALLVFFSQRDAESPADAHLPAAEAATKSIAVLPFTDLSVGQDHAYLADGMAEEILNLLARVPELRVISRNSAFAYKGKNVGVAEIARQLKVSHVLEGSVRMSGDRIRVTTQLIDASDESHLWSGTYDRTLGDLFDVQDDIAAKVVAQLKLELLGAVPKARRVDPQAYLYYVQARQRLDHGLDGARVHGLLQRALEIDPDYAQAWLGLHLLYYFCTVAEGDEFCSQLGAKEAERLGQEALAKALELDPQNATAIAFQAAHASWRGDLADAAAGFERAARLEPTNTDVMVPILHFTNGIRRPDLAIRAGEFVRERDPACSACMDQLARAYEGAGRLDQAEATIRAVDSPHILARILLQKGEAQAALDVVNAPGFVENADDRAWALHLQSMALHSLGRQSESAAALATLESEFGGRYAHLIAPAYAWRGDLRNAALWLEQHFDPVNGGPSAGQLTNPILQPVLADPRIRALLRQHGLAPEQLGEIRFELTLPGDS